MNKEGQVNLMDTLLAQAPSSNFPVLSSAPKRNTSIVSVDWRYFRAFPLSEIIDWRLDFCSATRTQGILSYQNGVIPDGVHHDQDIDTSCCSNCFGGCCSFLCNILSCKCCQKKSKPQQVQYGSAITDITNATAKKKIVYLRIKDQGSIIFDVSEGHQTSHVAQCIVALVEASRKDQSKQEEIIRREVNEQVAQRCKLLMETVQQLKADVLKAKEFGSETKKQEEVFQSQSDQNAEEEGKNEQKKRDEKLPAP